MRYMTLATEIYNETEIIPGACRRILDCTVADLDAAREIESRKLMLRCEAEVLVERAATTDTAINDDLRERLSIFAGLLPDLEALVGELRDAVLQPA
jgi:hypothetical protein